MLKLFDTWPALEIAIESNNKRGRKGKIDKAGPALTRTEYIHHTKDLFPNVYKDIAA